MLFMIQFLVLYGFFSLSIDVTLAAQDARQRIAAFRRRRRVKRGRGD